MVRAMTDRTAPALVSRRTLMRGGATIAVAMAGGGLTAALAEKSVDPPSNERAIEINARPITHFETANASKRRFGLLEYRGGLVLNSPAEAFGGYSGLLIEPNGRRIFSISDEGSWLAAEIVYDGDTPVRLQNARIGPIQGTGGRPLNKKRDLDAEALALVSGNLSNGTVLIGFERNHRIGRFPIVNGSLRPPTGYLPLPPDARRMDANKSFEAVTVLRGGPYKDAVIAFAERFLDKNGHHTGWLWAHNGAPQRLSVPDIDGFDLTDAASLPDGTLLLLERRFRWTEGVKMRIRRFGASTIKPGAVLDGETLIEANMSYQIDNMEGLALHQNARGETILTLISDNNFNPILQRTLLLQFALAAD